MESGERMDTKIENGNFLLNSRGIPETVSGLEAELQRAEIALSIPQGMFRYDGKLGSSISLEKQGEHYEERVLAAANEALINLGGIRALKVKLVKEGIEVELQTVHGVGSIVLEDKELEPEKTESKVNG